jgi:glycosyltransferase involved in cell wall biosynthesis
MSRVGIAALSIPRYGGTYQYTLAMIEALRRLEEHEYTIFTAPDIHWYDQLGLPVVRLPSAIPTAARIAAGSCGLSRRFGLFSKMDKVIAPIYSPYLLASAAPFAFTLHDLQEKHLPQYFSLRQRVWRHTINAMLARAATRVICESGHVGSDIKAFFPAAADKINVIPAPPLTTFRAGSLPEQLQAAVRARLQLPAEYLFYPSQFFPHKNHIRLIQAFARISKRHPVCHLLLTGNKVHDYEKVMSAVAVHGLSATVRHLGFLSDDDLAAVYTMATLVVIPTLFESISIPVYEAFTLGAPTCVSNVVALPEQVGDAAVLMDPYSIDDMASKISATLDNADLRRTLVERGTRRVETMTMERYAQQLRSLLAQLH